MGSLKKKRGRPVGSKNKPKKIIMTRTQVELAKKAGVPVEDYAKETGQTYSDVFDDYMPTAVRLMADKVVWAREQGKDIIWDQTSTTEMSRKRKFNMLPDYYAIAVIFKTPNEEELKKRLASRPGKEIPWEVVSSMASQLEAEPPTEEEGFNEIWHAE